MRTNHRVPFLLRYFLKEVALFHPYPQQVHFRSETRAFNQP
jgi:hypothetical protein